MKTCGNRTFPRVLLFFVALTAANSSGLQAADERITESHLPARIVTIPPAQLKDGRQVFFIEISNPKGQTGGSGCRIWDLDCRITAVQDRRLMDKSA
jgi:hypothetical protein